VKGCIALSAEGSPDGNVGLAVIPESAEGGYPESREKAVIHWIPDLVRRSRTRPV